MREKIKRLLSSTGVKPFICFALIVILVVAMNFINNRSESTSDNNKASESESSTEAENKDNDKTFDIHIGTGNTIALIGLIGALLIVQMKRKKDSQLNDDR